MSEESNGTVKRAGWGCLGCGMGILLGFIIVIAAIVVGIIALAAHISGDDSPSTSISQENPDKLEEEYISGKAEEKQAKIAVIDVHGVIAFDDTPISSDENADPRSICARIRRAAADKDVKAIIINLNTPGGEVVAADEIYSEIRRFRQKTNRPAIALMRTMAASGGYYIAAACKPIIANKLTMTGSIGVIISTYNYRGLFEKIGLQSEVYASGKMKDMLNGARARTPEEVTVVKNMVNETYSEFVRIVAESRKIPAERIRQSEIGDGRVFSGEQALKLGLIDSFGYFRDAVDTAAKQAGLAPNRYAVIRYKDSFSFGKFFSMLSSKSGKVPLNISLNGTQPGAFTPKRGMLYYLPADF
ncbi:MAG: signal peptide peptidase SppA [Lentisphaeria bacterium]|nr:signal peptide peptidase SppA [Lentisphaeria bacterium]